jgi:hypothetical protein
MSNPPLLRSFPDVDAIRVGTQSISARRSRWIAIHSARTGDVRRPVDAREAAVLILLVPFSIAVGMTWFGVLASSAPEA